MQRIIIFNAKSFNGKREKKDLTSVIFSLMMSAKVCKKILFYISKISRIKMKNIKQIKAILDKYNINIGSSKINQT